MKIWSTVLTFWALSVSGALLCADEQPVKKQSYLIEVRYFTITEGKMEEAIREIPLKSFAATSPDEQENGFEKLDEFELQPGDSGIHLVTARSAKETRLPVTVELLTEDQVMKFMRHVQSDARSNILFAPKVTVPAGEIAHIDDVTHRPFVTGINPQGLETDRPDLRPVVQVLDEGTRIATRVRELDGGVRQCDFRMVQSSITSVSAMSTGRGASMVQVPEVARNTVEFAARIQNDQHLLVWWPHKETSERRQVSGIARAASFIGGKNPPEAQRLGVLIRVSEAPDGQ